MDDEEYSFDPAKQFVRPNILILAWEWWMECHFISTVPSAVCALGTDAELEEAGVRNRAAAPDLVWEDFLDAEVVPTAVVDSPTTCGLTASGGAHGADEGTEGRAEDLATGGAAASGELPGSPGGSVAEGSNVLESQHAGKRLLRLTRNSAVIIRDP